MAEMTIAQEEFELLKTVLDYYLSELGAEISHTDQREFRDNLKDKKAMLVEIRARLDALE